MGTTYMNFGTGVFHVDGDAPLTQEQVDSVWLHLPTTGASWVERGHLFVQQRDGATAFNLGPVEPGIKGVSDSVRLHGKAGVKKSKTHHSTRKVQRHHSTKKKSPAQLDREIAEWQAARSGLSKHHQDLLLRRKPGGGLGAGYLTPAGWHGDPMVIEDRKLRLEALREQPAPRFPKERSRSHSTKRAARVFRTVEKHAPTEVGGRIDLTITETLTPQDGGVVVERHVTGMQEGRRVNDRFRKFYPDVTIDKAVAYRRRMGYVELA